MQKRIAVEHEKHEDGLQDKKGEAHDGFMMFKVSIS